MNGMNDTTPTCRELADFLSRYSAALLGSGATCIRLTKNVERIAARFGRKVELTVMPRHLHITVMGKDDEELITTISSPRGGISFNVNTLLSRLSWEVADGKVGFNELEAKLNETLASDHQNQWSVLLLASLANASFCRLFGGDLIAMAVVFIATMSGYHIKQLLLGLGADMRLTVIVCSFVSAVLGATDMLFGLGSTPNVALGTSVLYLVPGVPFLNSFSDMLYRHYICAFSRFVDAMVITCCLSIGLCGAMILMNVGMF